MDGSHNPHQHGAFDERVRERERRAGDTTRDGVVRALPGTSPDDVVVCGACANDQHERCEQNRRCDCRCRGEG